MLFLYNLGIKIYFLLIRIAALFNKKAADFIAGRKNLLKRIPSLVKSDIPSAWFHFASLGEFEQGRPVIEKLKEIKPDLSIVITFFSPSGYEIRKNYPLADHVFYLPLDTEKNAREFIGLINPQLSIFTKYEYWYYYYKILNERGVALYVISAIFRKNNIFFKWYGGLNRKILSFVTHFFVQDKTSANMLNSIGIANVTVSGDTRFDRVWELISNPQKIDTIAGFVGNKKVFIGGSTWAEDERLISSVAVNNPDWAFIIAPHEINESRIKEVGQFFSNSIRFSKLTTSSTALKSQTLIVDNIGLLASLYAYGDLAYIGGGFGKGIHNTLEAAAFGLPVIFGPRYDKFQEAKDLIEIGVAKSINNESELINAFNHFKVSKNFSEQAKEYVTNKKGATDIILKKIIL